MKIIEIKQPRTAELDKSIRRLCYNCNRKQILKIKLKHVDGYIFELWTRCTYCKHSTYSYIQHEKIESFEKFKGW